MKNLSLERSAIWIAIISFGLLTLLTCSESFAQANWTNIGNGYQSKVVGGFRDLRVVFTTGNLPFNVTDSLNKKLSLSGGDMTGDIRYLYDATSVNTNPNGGKGLLFNKNTDYGKVYFESTGSNNGSSNLIFENGNDNSSTGGGFDEGFIFRKWDILSDASEDILTLSHNNFKFKIYNVWHSGNFNPDTLGNLLTGYQLKSEKAVANGYASLGSDGKVPLSQINDALIGSVNYQGTYNIGSNTPPLPAVDPTNKGWYYLITDAKTVFQGDSVFAGDWLISNGIEWNSLAQNRPETDPIYNAQKSTLAKTDGSNATGTWPINAVTSTRAVKWGDGTSEAEYTGTPASAVNSYLLGYTAQGNWAPQSSDNVRLYAGIGNGSTLNNSISGNAVSATNLTGLTASISNLNSVTGILGSNAYTSTAYAPLASPALTGVPTAPTATAGTSTTQIATTAFVQNMAASVPTLANGSYTPTLSNTSNVSTSTINQFFYTRVGDMVQVTGSINVTPTTAGVISFNLTIPIASALVLTSDLIGMVQSNLMSSAGTQCNGDAGTSLVKVLYQGGGGESLVRISFTYKVK